MIITQFSFTLLINSKGIIAVFFHSYSNILRFMRFRLDLYWSMEASRIYFTDNKIIEIFNKQIPWHIKRSISRLSMIIILISKLFSPFWGIVRPLSIPYCLSPRITHFNNHLPIYVKKFEERISMVWYQS